jgi:hypothetical protein
MPDTNYEIGLKVAVTSEEAKLSDVVSAIEKVNQTIADSAKGHAEAAAAAKEHGGAVDTLAGKLVGLVATYAGLRTAWSLFKEGTEEFMRQERALGAISNTAKQFGQDGEAAAEATHALARELANVGVNENDVIGGTQRLMVVTKDYKQALSGASLAADLAVKTGKDYGTTLQIIQMLMTDSPRGLMMAQRQFGIEATNSADALAKLSAMGRGAAEQMRDTTAAAAGFSEIIHERWKDIGGMVASVWAPLARFAADYEKRQEQATIELEYRFKRMIGSTADADAWYADAMKKWKEKFGIPLGEAMAQLEVQSHKGKDLAALGTKMAADMKALQQDVDAAVAKQEKEDKAKQQAQENREQERDWDLKTKQAVKNAEDSDRRVQALALADQKATEDKLLASLRLYDAKVSSLDKLRLVDIKKMNLQELYDFQAMLKKKLDSEEMNVEQRNALTVKYAAATKQIADITAKEKLQQDAQAVASTTESVGQMFGVTKAAALATALVNAFAAAAGASAETHGDVYTRIAAYIAAFAQAYQAVAGIGSTELGSAGGAGGGGGAVYGGVSMSTPLPTIQNSSVATNVQGGNTYVINSIVGSKAVAETAQLQKTLRPGSRAYDRTITSRQPISAGTVRRG